MYCKPHRISGVKIKVLFVLRYTIIPENDGRNFTFVIHSPTLYQSSMLWTSESNKIKGYKYSKFIYLYSPLNYKLTCICSIFIHKVQNFNLERKQATRRTFMGNSKHAWEKYKPTPLL